LLPQKLIGITVLVVFELVGAPAPYNRDNEVLVLTKGFFNHFVEAGPVNAIGF